ncbi:MAG: helix-turn-helix transcriptional regulator [Clostridia bacterium]
MEDLKIIIAENLIDLRKQNKMTQSELAERLNYTDKAVSKWEHGDACPPIEVLSEIANMYNVTVDYLTHRGTVKEKSAFVLKNKKNNKIIIALLAVSLVWILATIFFVYCKIIGNYVFWQVFLWAIPASATLLIIFNGIWGRRKYGVIYVSIHIWSLLVCFYIQFIAYNLWPIFILGAPVQIAIVLWYNLKKQ